MRVRCLRSCLLLSISKIWYVLLYFVDDDFLSDDVFGFVLV